MLWSLLLVEDHW